MKKIIISLIIFLLSNSYPIYGQTECDFLCQLGQTGSNTTPSKPLNNNDYQDLNKNPSSSNDFYTKQELTDFFEDFLSTELGDDYNDYFKYTYDFFDIKKDLIIIKNLSIQIKENGPQSSFNDPWIRILTIQDYKCEGYNIGKKQSNPLMMDQNFNELKKTLDNSVCKLSIRIDAVFDEIIAVELLEEFGNDFSYALDDREILAILKSLVSNINISVGTKSVANGHQGFFQMAFGEEIKLRNSFSLGNIKDAHRFFVDISKNILSYYYDSPQEYQNYLDTLSMIELNEEIINASTLLGEEMIATLLNEDFQNFPDISFLNYEIDISWSGKLFDIINKASNNTVSNGIMLLRQVTLKKMSQYELSLLLTNTLGNEMTALLLPYIYDMYSQSYGQVRSFSLNPRGIGISFSSVDRNGIKINEVIEGIKNNPLSMLYMLSSLEIKLIANPSFRN